MTGFGNQDEIQKRQTKYRSKETGESLYTEGVRYHHKGDLVKAEKAYRKALKTNYLNHKILSNLGSICNITGRKDEAIIIYQKAISISPNQPNSYLKLGNLHQSLGNLNEAITLILKSLELEPNNPDALINLSWIYKELGNLDQSLASTLKSLELKPNNPDALLNLGSIYKALGKLDQSLASTLKSLELKPNNPDALLNLGSIYKALGKLDHARACTLRSLEIRPDNPSALINLGSIFKRLGNLDEALIATLKSLKLQSDSPEAIINLGGIYKDLGKLDQALTYTLKSLKIQPDNPIALMNLGGIYKDLNYLDRALSITLKSLRLKPGNPHALINLSGIYKDLGMIEDAKKAIMEVLKITTYDSPTVTRILDFFDSINEEEELDNALLHLGKVIKADCARISIYKARMFYRRKDYAASWEQISTLDENLIEKGDWFSRIKYHAFKAAAGEKTRHYSEAYKHYALSQLDPLYKNLNHKYEHERIKNYIILSKKIGQRIKKSNKYIRPKENIRPVFLIGFPRSGTTLLDMILRSHPNIEVLEEKDPLSLTEKTATEKLKTNIVDFDSLKEEDLNILRNTYAEKVRHYSVNNSATIIDKLPLNTIPIPLINLLFPRAKVIFAIRHPCDSILSCFQQTFSPSNAMANFTTLERSVDFYNQVMCGWRSYNDNLSIDKITSKYENLINNFDGSITKILNHLDLDWDDSVHNYRETAIKHRYIQTPSASQVIQPIYNSSTNRWKNYHAYFRSHMQTLQPWIDYFGYS